MQSTQVSTQDLSDEQQLVMDAFNDGNNVFITGPGGCGKSYLIQKLYK